MQKAVVAVARVACCGAVEAGTCDVRLLYYIDVIEKTVIAGIREKPMDRQAI